MSSHTVTIEISTPSATVTMRVTGEAEISISTRSIRGNPHGVSTHPNGNILYPSGTNPKNVDYSYIPGPMEQPGETSSRSAGSSNAVDMDETEVEEEEDDEDEYEEKEYDEEQDEEEEYNEEKDDFEEELDNFEEEQDELADDVDI